MYTAEVRMHSAEEEVKSLKRAASREDTTPEAKKQCVDEAVRKILQLNKDTKLTAVREAAKHTVISQTRKIRGLAPAGEPTGAMLDKSLQARNTELQSPWTGVLNFSWVVSSWTMSF